MGVRLREGSWFDCWKRQAVYRVCVTVGVALYWQQYRGLMVDCEIGITGEGWLGFSGRVLKTE